MNWKITHFEEEILSTIRSRGLEFPELDDEAILTMLVPQAEDWVFMYILNTHASTSDRELFRDAYAVSPEDVDTYEFLAERFENLDELVEEGFSIWLDQLSTWVNHA